jgi:NAD(P)-dependent dehydrogenase (short-subunit alcohol dehydrogenase family)
MRHDLKEQVAVVTGAGRGIGAAIARVLASLGATTILCARSRGALESTAAAILKSGGKAEVAECDVTDLQSVERLSQMVESRWKRLDVLVNNAGVGSFSTPLHTMAPEDWEKVMNTNLRGIYYCIRALAPLMIKAKAGHIVNISSLAGKNALPNGAAYAASKWGLNGLSYSVAEELRAYGIRVSVVCPGSTNTDLSPHIGKNVEKMLQPDDIAHVVKMLVTQDQRSFASEVLIRPTAKP